MQAVSQQTEPRRHDIFFNRKDVGEQLIPNQFLFRQLHREGRWTKEVMKYQVKNGKWKEKEQHAVPFSL